LEKTSSHLVFKPFPLLPNMLWSYWGVNLSRHEVVKSWPGSHLTGAIRLPGLAKIHIYLHARKGDRLWKGKSQEDE
jgi:hypothetical protein